MLPQYCLCQLLNNRKLFTYSSTISINTILQFAQLILQYLVPELFINAKQQIGTVNFGRDSYFYVTKHIKIEGMMAFKCHIEKLTLIHHEIMTGRRFLKKGLSTALLLVL